MPPGIVVGKGGEGWGHQVVLGSIMSALGQYGITVGKRLVTSVCIRRIEGLLIPLEKLPLVSAATPSIQVPKYKTT